MHKFFYIVFILSVISLTGCPSKVRPTKLSSIDGSRCIKHSFAQGQDDNLYGIDCIQGKRLVIRSSKEGETFSTTQASESLSGGLIIEDDVDFINKVYELSYNVLKGKGDDKERPFLRAFLPEDERFLGTKNTKYDIVFELEGDHLVLFKASKNKQDIPYIYWSSLRKRDGYYMVPFIGYKVDYCKAELIENENQELSYRSRVNCEDSHLQSADYIRLRLAQKKIYKYLPKPDMFPANYFDGEWFFSEGAIKSYQSGEINFAKAFLVQMEKEKDQLVLRDASGVQDSGVQKVFSYIPVKWLDFEMAKDSGQFTTFGEREDTAQDEIARPYLQINFSRLGGEIIELEVSKDYFSYVIQRRGGQWKKSYLRASAFDSKGFKPTRWFYKDYERVFGYLPTSPTSENPLAEIENKTGEDLYKNHRAIKFNTSLNTEEEKRTKTKTIKWYFSKNSTKDPEYRAVARKAVAVFDRAFELMAKDSGVRVKVELIEDEDKPLGDSRYNVINLLRPTQLTAPGLLGFAPSRSHPETGQIISSVSNVLVLEIEETIYDELRQYIRYEVFERDRRTETENETHVVPPYLRDRIKKECPEIKKFIGQTKNRKGLQPRTVLNDQDLILSCTKTLAKPAVMDVLIHELGHNFGLAHNPKCSTDGDNYYQSEEELKAFFPEVELAYGVPKSACIMDYVDYNKSLITVLGKQDIAALRYLYMDQVEMSDGSIKSLNSSAEPLKQVALLDQANVMEERRNYLHCGQSLTGSDILCTFYDLGSNPKEIAENYIAGLKRAIIGEKFRYDLSEKLFRSKDKDPYRKLGYLWPLYREWRKERKAFLASRSASYILSEIPFEEESAKRTFESYQSLLVEGNTSSNKRYSMYYPMRSLFIDLMEYINSLEEMTCHLEKESKVHKIPLNFFITRLSSVLGESLYVRDCYSDHVIGFIEEQGFNLVGQSGLENFRSYTPFTDKKTVDMSTSSLNYRMILSEPDVLRELYFKARANLLDRSKNKTPVNLRRNTTLFQTSAFDIRSLLGRRNLENIDQLDLYGNDRKILRYYLGHRTDSFYDLVEQPLKNGDKEVLNKVPFLKKAYEDYQREVPINQDGTRLSLEDYLISREDTVYGSSDNGGSNYIKIPFKTDSFSAKAIRVLNLALKDIKQLREKRTKEGLSLIEAYELEALSKYADALSDVIF